MCTAVVDDNVPTLLSIADVDIWGDRWYNFCKSGYKYVTVISEMQT